MHDFEKQPSEIKRGLLPNLPCDITVYSSDDSFRDLHIDGEKDIQMGCEVQEGNVQQLMWNPVNIIACLMECNWSSPIGYSCFHHGMVYDLYSLAFLLLANLYLNKNTWGSSHNLAE